MAREKLKVLDLFSGIGGFSLGLERAGMQTVAFCEIDPFCRKVLKKHWPDVPIFEDVKTLKGSDVGPVDVITAGFPCQDIAICGTGKGLDGEKSGLWSEVERLAGELRPRLIILENSTEILDGRWMGRLLGGLACLGYDAEWDMFPALAFGSPHRRDRFYLVAYPCGAGQEKQYMPTIAGKAEQRQYSFGPLQRGFFWPEDQPPVLRDGHDVPSRVDRIGALGNAVVPQIPEMIGRAIIEAERGNQHGA